MERGEVDLGSESARRELTGALKAAVGARDDAQLRLLHRFARGLRFFLNVEEGVCADMSRRMLRQSPGLRLHPHRHLLHPHRALDPNPDPNPYPNPTPNPNPDPNPDPNQAHDAAVGRLGSAAHARRCAG